MRRRGWGPLKEDWYSFCSQHQHYDESCSRCRAGSWHNVYTSALSRFAFKVSPRLWRWWANR